MRRRAGDYLLDTANILALLFAGLVTAYPFYYVLIYSLSDPSLSISGVTLLPRGLTLYNYVHVFRSVDLLHAGMISVLRTFIGAAFTVAGCSVFAYAIGDANTPGRKVVYRLSVASMYLSAGLIPWYLTMRFYGLQNSFLLYVVPSTIDVFFVMLIKTYFEQVPNELKEAAKIDGAGHLRILFLVILPVSVPILATVFIFAAVSQWNAWMDNFLLNTDENLKTLQLVLLEYIKGQEALMASIVAAAKTGRDISEIAKQIKVTPRSIQMTITMVVALPIFLVYPFVQKYFMKALLLGAVKG